MGGQGGPGGPNGPGGPGGPNGPGGQGGLGGPGGQGGQGNPIALALSPSHLNNQDLLDYITKAGLASYKMAVASLSKSLYDGTKENTHLFRVDFARRANACGWEVGVEDNINIPEVNHPNTTKGFIYQNAVEAI